MIDVIESVNREYVEIWAKYAQAGELPRHEEPPFLRWPAQYPSMAESVVTFVGFNPSFSKNEIEKRGFDISNLTWTDGDPDPQKPGILIQEHEAAIGRLPGHRMYPFFRPLELICDQIGARWEHIDLFPLREKNQKAAQTILGFETSPALSTRFSRELFGIFDTLVESLKPRLLIVANAFACDVIRTQKNVSTDWQSDVNYKKRGFHTITFGEAKMPVVFTGMLSGQRQIDKGSREHLAWRLSRILDQA